MSYTFFLKSLKKYVPVILGGIGVVGLNGINWRLSLYKNHQEQEQSRLSQRITHLEKECQFLTQHAPLLVTLQNHQQALKNWSFAVFEKTLKKVGQHCNVQELTVTYEEKAPSSPQHPSKTLLHIDFLCLDETDVYTFLSKIWHAHRLILIPSYLSLRPVSNLDSKEKGVSARYILEK